MGGRLRPAGILREDHGPGDLEQAVVEEVSRGWQPTLVGFHRLHGYRGGWLYLAWALIYDLSSLAMIVFAVTGVVLCFSTTRRRTAGWIILSLGFAFTAGMILYLR